MTHERTKKDLLYSMIFFSIALVFFYIAYIIVPRIDIALILVSGSAFLRTPLLKQLISPRGEGLWLASLYWQRISLC